MKRVLTAALFSLALGFAPSACAQGIGARSGGPPPGAPICYAAYWGSDINDGLSWDTAKNSMMACYDRLPAGGGFVYFSEGNGGERTPVNATNVSGCGIWIMGGTDPNFAKPPACWRKVKAVTFIGAGGINSITHILAGSSADNNHPAIWLSGTQVSIRFENVSYQYPSVGIRLGCNSVGNCSDGTGGVSGVRFDNVVGHINTVAGSGPNVFIGSNSFWDFFYNCGFQGNPAEQVTATLVRASNVVTATTSSPFTVTSAEHFGILSSTDTSFNGSFAIASVANSTHFTFNQDGPNATTTGVIITDKQIPIVEDPGTGTGSGLIYVSGQSGGNVYSMGGMRVWSSFVGGVHGLAGAYVDHLTVEGDFAHVVAPALWLGNAFPSPVDIRVDSVEMADTQAGAPAVEIDCVATCGPKEIPGLQDDIVVTHVTYSNPVIGPHSGSGTQPTDGKMSPLRNGYIGTAYGRLVGSTDAARRLFTLAASPDGAVDEAYPTPDLWTITGGAITAGALAPDGSTGAASITSSSGTTFLIIPSNVPSGGGSPGPPLVVGDIFVYGLWIKNPGNGAPSAAANYINGALTDCNSSGQGAVLMQNLDYNDGQWQYVTAICKITKVDSTIGVAIIVPITAGTTTYVYQPVIYGYAAGAISDNEAYEVMNNLSGTGTCNTGTLCTNLPISAKSLTAPLTTPASSTASCGPGGVGAIAWDAAYIYVCIAANRWRRVALSAF
jgi:hypothetical protein